MVVVSGSWVNLRSDGSTEGKKEGAVCRKKRLSGLPKDSGHLGLMDLSGSPDPLWGVPAPARSLGIREIPQIPSLQL